MRQLSVLFFVAFPFLAPFAHADIAADYQARSRENFERSEQATVARWRSMAFKALQKKGKLVSLEQKSFDGNSATFYGRLQNGEVCKVVVGLHYGGYTASRGFYAAEGVESVDCE